jgi:hypothetical protein
MNKYDCLFVDHYLVSRSLNMPAVILAVASYLICALNTVFFICDEFYGL